MGVLDSRAGRIRVGLAVVVGLAAIYFVGAAQENKDKADNAAQVEQLKEDLLALAPAEVTYELEGTVAYVEATMTTPTGVVEQSPDLPMTATNSTVPGITYKFPRGSIVGISAALTGDYGKVTCRIKVDGKVISENTSSGDYSTVTCSGRAD